MTDLRINSFGECQQCAECCKIPCELIPSDLPPLLGKFGMPLSEFFRKHLIALIISSRNYADEVLMMAPVKVDSAGNRIRKFLADNEYLHTQGTCIFLQGNKCGIHESKPLGGRSLQCYKITGSVEIRSHWDEHFAHWLHNQHLFELIFPGFAEVFSELKPVFQRKNEILPWWGYTAEYHYLHQKQVDIITRKLFPLFNNSAPRGSFTVFHD